MIDARRTQAASIAARALRGDAAAAADAEAVGALAALSGRPEAVVRRALAARKVRKALLPPGDEEPDRPYGPAFAALLVTADLFNVTESAVARAKRRSRRT
jgi:hypothetical protein